MTEADDDGALNMLNKKRGYIYSKRWSVLASLLVFSFTFLVYLNSLDNSFHYDDIHSIVNNPHIRSLENIPDFLTNPEMFSENPSWKMYRPLLLMTYALNYWWGEYDVRGYHVVNIFLHAVNSIIVFLIALRILNLFETKDKKQKIIYYLPAFTASLLFGVHTLNTHPVNLISSRSVLLVLLFYLGSFYFYIKSGVRTRKNFASNLLPLTSGFYLLSLLFYSSALLSKEIAITLPLILLMYDFVLGKGLQLGSLKDGKGCKGYSGIRLWCKDFFIWFMRRHLLFWLISFGYLSLRANLLGHSVIAISKDRLISGVGGVALEGAMTMSAGGERSIYINVLNQFKALVFYLKALFLPVGLSVEHDVEVASGFWDIKVLLSFLLIIMILTAGLMLWKKNRVLSFSVFWFFIGSMPETLIPLNLIINEHRAYLPGVGFVFFMGYLVQILWLKCEKILQKAGDRSPKNFRSLLSFEKYKIFLIGAVIIVISFNAYGTVKRNHVWKDEITLWGDAVAKYPYRLFRGHNNLGKAYAEKGLLNKAIEEYKITLEVNPRFAEAHFNLGLSYYENGMIKEALFEYREFLKSNPGYVDAHINLGNVYVRLGLFDKAVNEYRKALKVKPENAQIHYNLGVAYEESGLHEAAVEEYKEALRIDPDYADAHYDLAVFYHREDRIDLAEKHYKDVLRINPDDTDARNNLGLIYRKKREFKESL